MSIVDYGSLKAAVIDEMHRRDMGDRVGDFVDYAHREIVRWVNGADVPPLVGDTDTNVVLDAYPDAYRFGALARGSAFVRDYDAAASFQVQFQVALTDLASSTIAFPNGLQPTSNTLDLS